MIASFVSFKSREDIVYDKAKGYIPVIIGPVCSAFGLEAVGKVLEKLSKAELEEKYEPIRLINEVYEEGEWASNVEIIPVDGLLRYYKRAAKNLKEMSREEVERKLAQSQKGGASDTSGFQRIFRTVKKGAGNVALAARKAVRRELERTNGSLLSAMLELEEAAILPCEMRESYMAERGAMMGEILTNLDAYAASHAQYAEFIKDSIKPILKRKKEWNDSIGISLKELYSKLINARKKLKNKVYDYIEHSACGYRANKEVRVSSV